MSFIRGLSEHPKGLFYLFFTEVWERFSYYGMRAILVLYLTHKTTGDNPGLGWSDGDALSLYGWYTMLVYVASIPGGFLADKILGQRKTIMLGGVLLCLGHLILAVEALWAFYTGLLLIVLGVGGLKPNISTMVGALYKDGDIRRDKGFMIFYMGINLGAFLSSIIVGWLGESIGWHYGFGLAGLCMILGQFTYIRGQKHLRHVGNLIDTDSKTNNQTENTGIENSLSALLKGVFKYNWPLSIFSVLAILSTYILLTSSIGYGLLGIFLSFVVGVMMVIYRDLNAEEKDRYSVLLISFIIVIVFWGAFEQAGGLMNLYTVEKIDRHIAGFEVPTSWFQSTNALFIILLGMPISAFWLFRKKLGKEVSSIFKMAVGTIIMGLGFLFMAKASLEAASEPFGKGLLIWLILAYAFHTTGELCTSPVALSFITKLSPKKYAAVMMGVYFAATGLGNKVAGIVGEVTQTEPIEFYIPAANYHLPEIDKKGTSYLKAEIYREVEGLQIILVKSGQRLSQVSNFLSVAQKDYINSLFDSDQQTLYAKISSGDKPNFEKGYKATLKILKEENQKELKTFVIISLFAVGFGLMLYLFLHKLKKMTHGIEEKEQLASPL